MPAGVRVCRLSGFDDARLGSAGWNSLLPAGETDVVFLTWEWQRAWWDSFRREELLLLLAERDGQPVALAPFFAEDRAIYFVGSGGSDYLDFIGDTSDGEMLDALLATAWREVPEAQTMILYHVPEESRTGARLRESAARLGCKLKEEIGLSAHALSLSSDAGCAAQKKSLLRHEHYFQRTGKLEIRHLAAADEVANRLEDFFAQHIERWRGTDSPSLFQSETQREFYRILTAHGARAGWLRFTEVRWNGAPIALHFGSCYAGRYLWYKPSFDVALARYSPGEVLLRHLLLAARAEGAELFDFGLGDEAFKRRFATETRRVINYTIIRR